MPAVAIKVMEKLARDQIGYREGPKNNETNFGKWFGMNFQAWCAIFLSWLSYHAGVTYLGKPWRFASTIAARDNAKKNKRWTTTPTIGTFAMMAHSSTTGHVGFVIYLLRRNGVLIVGSIEGNTNDQGAREGNGVWLRERVASSWDGYIILDQTYNGGDEQDMDGNQAKQLDDLWRIVFEHSTPQGNVNTILETWQRTKNLEAVATRDIETLRPLIVEVLEAVKNSDEHGPVGTVDANAVVDALVERLKE